MKRAWLTTIAVTVALFGGLLVTALPAAGLPVPATSAPTAKNTCAPPVPGQASCFALERTDLAALTAAGATPAGYGPSDLQSAYHLPAATGGTGQTVAVIEGGDDQSAEADLGTYRAHYGLSACTSANGCFRKVNQNGQAGPLPAFNSTWTLEMMLDVDMVSAACPNCHILLVEANDAKPDDLFSAVNAAVSLGAKFVSMSFGFPETSAEVGYDTKYLTHPGVVMTASTGDVGAEVLYPAMSPNVIAVGGTSLKTATTSRGWAETAWSSGGSGCSVYEPAPAYQHGLTSCAKKADADISAVADPATGVSVYAGGTWFVLGGTSVASPLIAASYALAGARSTTDNPGTDLYAREASLNDVVSGSNGSCQLTVLCQAGPGWDGPTGLGTPNGIAALQPANGRTPPASTVAVTNPVSQSTAVNTAVTLPIQALDSAGLSLTYAATGLPTGLSINSATGLISGSPTVAGSRQVTVTVADSSGASGSAAFSWTITAPAAAPPAKVTLTNPGNQTTVAGATVALALQANDSAGSPLTYTASGLPAGLSLAGPTGLITGAPSTAGSYRVTVSARDATGASANATFSWTVSAILPPAPAGSVTIASPGNKSTAIGSAVYCYVTATDSAGLKLTFSASGLPAGLAIDAATGLIKGTPTAVGSSPVSVSVTDASGASASVSFTWAVTVSKTAPVTVTVANPGTHNTAAGTSVKLQIAATDSNGSALIYSATGLPAGLAINAATGLITGSAIGGSGVIYNSVTVYVSGAGGTAGSSVGFLWIVTSN